jgi:AraC-like DNA-binding protein
MRDTTIAAEFVEMMIEGATERLASVDDILLRHGISRLSLGSPDYRVPLESFARVAIELMQSLDDEFMGLTEKPQPVGSFNMMSRACISAGTIKKALQRCANFWNLFKNTFEHRVLVSGGRIYYEMHPRTNARMVNNYAIESMLSTVHRFHCWLGGQFIPLQSVSLNYSEPHYSDAYRALFYAAPIRYDRPYPGLQFDAKFGQQDIVQTSEALDRYLEGQNLSLLNQPRQYRAISDQVRRWLEKSMRAGFHAATLAEAANHFRMSQQVLHRRLRAENSSFKELKMQTRRDVAINLLFSERYKVEEIATMVGFSEPSAFIRAFKTWTGATPLQYRQQRP